MSREGSHICGPSGQQTLLAGQEASFASLLQANYAQQFGAQSKVLENLNRIFTPIAQAGPSQRGMSPEQRAALETSAMVNVSGATRSAQQAARTTMAGRGGGAASPLASGIDQQIAGSIAGRGAQTLAGLQTGITQQDYTLGRENWREATSGLNALAGQYNPTAYGQLGTSANQSAFNQATKIQEMRNQQEAAIYGSIGSVGMSALTGGLNGITSGLSALSGGANMGGGACCWVATELYGSMSNEMLAVKHWLETTKLCKPFVWIYRRIGPAWANAIRKYLWLRKPTKLLFDFFLRQARSHQIENTSSSLNMLTSRVG